MKFGHKIKSARILRSLSQQQLAKRAGICRRTVMEYEADKSEPNVSRAIKLAKALEIRFEDIFLP